MEADSLSRVPAGAPGGDEPARATLALFAALWGVACLFHQSEFIHWGRNPIELGCTVAAVCAVCWPRSLPAFLALCILQVAAIFDQMPEVSNHWLHTGVVSSTILASALVVWLKARGRSFDPGSFYRAFAPLVRIELLILYFFVVFHKLNTDFFSVDVSCGAKHYRHLLGLLPWLPHGLWAQEANIWLTIGIESLIPILLVFRRTRTLGILTGALFHYFLGINFYFDFSSMLYASYILFAPGDMALRVAERWRSSAPGRLLQRLPPWLIGLAIFLIWAVVTHNSFRDPFHRFGQVWKVYGLLWIAGFVWAVKTRGLVQEASGARILRPLVPALLVMPLLLFCNGMSPYFGLKTGSSFAMFSNLRTEAGQSNHLLIPPGALQVWDYQTDLVTVLHSSDRRLAKIARQRRPIPYFTLRTLVSSAARHHAHDLELTYLRRGRRIALDHAERNRQLARPYGLLARKFFHFRTIQLSAKETCGITDVTGPSARSFDQWCAVPSHRAHWRAPWNAR